LAPSGSAYVLMAVSGWRDYIGMKIRPDGGWAIKRSPPHDALCLMRNGTQGGAGSCTTVEAMRRGALRGIIAGQAYGVVPDGVARIRPAGSATEIPVRHNFFTYSARPRERPYPQPIWLDPHGRLIPKPRR
jgi:hypothetical protein